MLLKFTKMHGAGNDFVVVDLISQRYKLRPRDVRLLADRRLGVGCDQVLVVEAPAIRPRGFSLSHLQRRWQRSRAVRQRRALFRPFRAREKAHNESGLSPWKPAPASSSCASKAATRWKSTWARRSSSPRRYLLPQARPHKLSTAGRRHRAGNRRGVDGQPPRCTAGG